MKKYFLTVVVFAVFLSAKTYADDEQYTLKPYKTREMGVSYQRLRFKLQPLLVQAQKAVDSLDFEKAYALYHEALDMDSGNYIVKEKLVNICFKLNKEEEAFALAKDVLDVNPSYIPVLLKKAYYYKEKNRLQEALDAFRGVYDAMQNSDPKKQQVRNEIIYVAEKAGNDLTVIEYSTKKADYNKAMEFTRIRSLWRAHEYDKASKEIEIFFEKVQDNNLKKNLWGYILSYSVEREMISQGILFFEKTSAFFYDFDTALDFLYAIRKKGDYKSFLHVASAMQELGTEEERSSDILTYEKAQIHEKVGNRDAYLQEMKKLTEVSGSVAFLKEYASRLFKEGSFGEAYEIVEQIVAKTDDPKIKYKQTIVLAVILLQQGKAEEADLKLQEALKYGEADLEWKLNAANIAYAKEAYTECIEILTSISKSGISDRERITLAYCYYKNHMFGISLYQLNQVKNMDMLSYDELYDLYMNTFYIMFSYGLYDEILKRMPKADAIEENYSNNILKLKSLGRVGQYRKVIELAEYILDKYPLSLSDRDDIYLELARAFSVVAPEDEVIKIKRYEEIINQTYFREQEKDNKQIAKDGSINLYRGIVYLYTEILQNDAFLSDAYYERSIAYKNLGEFKKARADLEKLFEINPSPPVMAYGDMATICIKMDDDYFARIYFEKYLKYYNYSLDSLSDTGYTLMRLVRNDYAMCMFSHAVDIYNRINPLMEDAKKETLYLNKAHNLRKELSALDKFWGFYPYVEINDFDLEDDQETVVRGLPSQAGAEISWRPPVIGFRDYRIFEAYVGFSTRLEQETHSVLKDYTQGVFGLRYKPLKAANLNLAIEKHYKIGKFARDDYLLRAMFSDETNKDKHVFSPQTFFINYSFFLEGGKFLKHERESYAYLDCTVGPAKVLKGSGFLLTFPRFRFKRRWQDDNTPSTAKYSMFGAGIALRKYEKEKEYFTQRWYVDIYIEYMQGKFEDSPFAEDDFSGVVMGVQFLR